MTIIKDKNALFHIIRESNNKDIKSVLKLSTEVSNENEALTESPLFCFETGGSSWATVHGSSTLEPRSSSIASAAAGL